MSDLEYENAFLKRHGYLPEQAIERIKELEAENKMLRFSLAAHPDIQTSTGAAQAVMTYEIELRDRRIAELEARAEKDIDIIKRQTKRINELEAVVKGECPNCGEELESSCFGQSTNCWSCDWSLNGKKDSE